MIEQDLSEYASRRRSYLLDDSFHSDENPNRAITARRDNGHQIH